MTKEEFEKLKAEGVFKNFFRLGRKNDKLKFKKEK